MRPLPLPLVRQARLASLAGRRRSRASRAPSAAGRRPRDTRPPEQRRVRPRAVGPDRTSGGAGWLAAEEPRDLEQMGPTTRLAPRHARLLALAAPTKRRLEQPGRIRARPV